MRLCDMDTQKFISNKGYETFWKKKMLPKLVEFFKVAIVTEVLTERVRRVIPLFK